ncbi:MAG: hypothetical protein ACYCSF_14195 [Acidimicrobiales bacterium]
MAPRARSRGCREPTGRLHDHALWRLHAEFSWTGGARRWHRGARVRRDLLTGGRRGDDEGVFAPLPEGFHPFWFWNDRITPEGIRRQIAQMADQEVSGFFIHSRQGLHQPYLSAGYFELVSLAITAGRAAGLAVHLYDEYPYPSGAAGGAVVQSDPAFVGTKLQTSHWKLQGGQVRLVLPPGKVLVCTAFPVIAGETDWTRPLDLGDSVGMVLSRESFHDAGVQAYNDRRFFADAPMPVLETMLGEGSWELWAATSVPVSDHKYWGAFPDVTNPAAVELFIELTHESYKRHLGPTFGEVSSIFVDEVVPEASSSVIAELGRRHGDQLGALLIAFAAPSHPEHLRALREVDTVRLQLFEESFEAPIRTWCRRHAVRYLGEKPSLRLSQLSWMDVPGCEPGHTKAGAPHSDLLQAEIRGNARATASAAYFYGKEGSLCECYHSLGWGATLQDAKLIAELLLVLGTRWLVPHAFFYSTRGLRKHDAPPSFLQMPYWSLFGELSRRVKAIARAFEGTWIDAGVAVVEPSGGLADAAQLRCYELLQQELMRAHCDFLTVDTDVLRTAKIHRGAASLREVSIGVVVVPPMRDLEPELERWLASFGQSGGIVARIYDETNLGEMAERVRTHCPPRLGISASDGDAALVLGVTRRDRAGGLRWLLVNTAPRSVSLNLTPRAGRSLVPVALDAAPPPNLGWSSDHFELVLDAFESVLIAEAPRPLENPSAQSRTPPTRLEVPSAGLWSFRLASPNLLRLGHWQLSLPEQSSEAAVVVPAPIANQLLRSGLAFAPAIKDRFGRSPTIEFPELLVRYETAVVSTIDARICLMMEPGALSGDWRLWFDGQGPYSAESFTPGAGYVEGCVHLELDAWTAQRHESVLPRRHVIVIEARVRSGEEGLRDCLYLGGSFGVMAAPPSTGGSSAPIEREGEDRAGVPVLASLVQLPDEVEIGAWEASGLPYYAGTVEYSRLLGRPDLQDTAEIEVELILPAGCEDAAEISFGGGRFHPLPWSPRKALVPRDDILRGEEAIDVRVRLLTTLARAFEGRWFDTRDHAYHEVELATAPRLVPPR